MDDKSGYFVHPVTKQVRAQFFNMNTVFKIATSSFEVLSPTGLYDACSVANILRGVLGARVNPDTFRIRVDVKIFETGKKKFRIRKYPGRA